MQKSISYILHKSKWKFDDYRWDKQQRYPKNNKIAVCFIDGEFTVKRIKTDKDCVYLMPENERYQPIKVTDENELIIWGIVTYVIKNM